MCPSYLYWQNIRRITIPTDCCFCVGGRWWAERGTKHRDRKWYNFIFYCLLSAFIKHMVTLMMNLLVSFLVKLTLHQTVMLIVSDTVMLYVLRFLLPAVLWWWHLFICYHGNRLASYRSRLLKNDRHLILPHLQQNVKICDVSRLCWSYFMVSFNHVHFKGSRWIQMDHITTIKHVSMIETSFVFVQSNLFQRRRMMTRRR